MTRPWPPVLGIEELEQAELLEVAVGLDVVRVVGREPGELVDRADPGGAVKLATAAAFTPRVYRCLTKSGLAGGKRADLHAIRLESPFWTESGEAESAAAIRAASGSKGRRRTGAGTGGV